MNMIKHTAHSLNVLALAALILSPVTASAEKITKHTDSEGWEEWYWTKSVKVSRGQSHTFWIKGLTENTAIYGMEVYYSYKYKEDGETYEDRYYASESCESEDWSEKYVLLTADDWADIPGSGSVSFTVYVDGWGPDEDQTTADISFTFGHSEGSGDYPGQDPEPVVVTPVGTRDNPVTFTIADTDTVQDVGSVDWKKSDTWYEEESVDGKVYLNTPSLVAGRKYVFGFAGIATNVTMALKTGGDNLFTADTVSTLVPECTDACWAVVAPETGVYEIVVESDSNDFTCYFGADAWDPQDDLATGATRFTPSSKGVSADRTLWADDAADWFSFATTAGTYYKFAFAEKSGSPEVRVFDDDGDECTYTLLKDPASSVMVAAADKSTYYVKVSRAEGAAMTDDPYTLVATSANPGTIKFAKTAIAVKDSAGYVDLSVSRTASEGATRVTYTTVGEQTSAEDALYYPTAGTLEWANGDKGAKTIRVKIVPQKYGTPTRSFQVRIASVDPESGEFDTESEFPAVIDAKTGDTATVTVTATAKATPGTIQLADCSTPKKPVVEVMAGELVELDLERVLGTDGLAVVTYETAKGKAVPGTDFMAIVGQELEWKDGESGRKTIPIQTLANKADYTAVKSFTVKLKAKTGKSSDGNAYAKATLASATITINILNDKFATTVAAHATALKKTTSGIAIKESKSGTWFVGNNGSIYSSQKTGALTFTLTGPGVFKYSIDGEEQVPLTVAFGQKKDNTVVIEAGETLDWYKWEPIPENLETLHQCVKYTREFTNGVNKVAAGKLPDGLKLAQDKKTKVWSISGVPTKAGYFYVKLTDTVKGKAQPTVIDEISFNVVAAGTAIGTFSGIAETFHTDDGLRSLASVTLTAAATGKLSAKVLTGGKTYTFADTGYASFEDDGVQTSVMAELPLVQKIGAGKTAETVTNWLYCTIIDAPETNAVARNAELNCEIRFAKLPFGKEYTDDVWYEGTLCRDNSKVAAWVSEASKLAGYYTVSLVNNGANEGEPKGNGYLTLTFDAKGKVKIAGLLADGTTYSASGVSAALVERYGATAISLPLYACKGTSVFGGWLELAADEESGTVIVSSDAKLVWANDALTATRDGESGFKLELVPVGGWYDTITNLQKWFIDYDFSVDLPTWDDDFESLLPAGYETYAFAANPCGQAVDVCGDTVSVIKQSLVKDATTKLVDFEKSVNASNVKLTFKRATGVLTGTFDLWYEGINEKTMKAEQKSLANLKHNGVLLLSRGDYGYLEEDVWTSGFYLVPKAGGTKWTGSYRFDVKATDAKREWSDNVE